MAQLCQDTSPLSTSALARAAATEAAESRARRQSEGVAFQTPDIGIDNAARPESRAIQDATYDDDGERADSSDRVSALEKQVEAMNDLVKKVLLQNQQQAADAQARENALKAQLAAANAASMGNSQLLSQKTPHQANSNMLFNPYEERSVRLSSVESTSCMWSGKRGGMDWRTARATLFKTIAAHSLRMAAIAKGEYKASDAEKMGSAAEHIFEIDNMQLASLVFRTIKNDTKDGSALRSQIVQDAERKIIDDNDGIALLQFLDKRDSYRSQGEKREGAAELKKMQMNISMTSSDVDQFVTSCYDLYSRCTGDELAHMGAFQDVLLAKMPSQCKQGANTLRLNLESSATLGGGKATIEQLKSLIAGEMF